MLHNGIHRILHVHRLVLRIRADAEISHFPLGEKFGCNADTDGPNLIQLSHDLGLNVSEHSELPIKLRKSRN